VTRARARGLILCHIYVLVGNFLFKIWGSSYGTTLRPSVKRKKKTIHKRFSLFFFLLSSCVATGRPTLTTMNTKRAKIYESTCRQTATQPNQARQPTGNVLDRRRSIPGMDLFTCNTQGREKRTHCCVSSVSCYTSPFTPPKNEMGD
jgi:hypothetical protein